MDREVFTTSGTYPWSFVTHIFHSGLPSHGGDRNIFEVMTSTLPKRFLEKGKNKLQKNDKRIKG